MSMCVAIHSHVRGRAVPKVMKPKVQQICPAYRRFPRLPEVDRSRRIASRKQQVCVDSPNPGQILHLGKRMSGQRHRSGAAILGFVQPDLKPLQVDVGPAQAHDFTAAHAGGQGKHHDGVKGYAG